MGLRGKARSEAVAAMERAAWRAYIEMRVLGYLGHAHICEAVAARLGVKPGHVDNVTKTTLPDGCYENSSVRPVLPLHSPLPRA